MIQPLNWIRFPRRICTMTYHLQRQNTMVDFSQNIKSLEENASPMTQSKGFFSSSEDVDPSLILQVPGHCGGVFWSMMISVSCRKRNKRGCMHRYLNTWSEQRVLSHPEHSG